MNTDEHVSNSEQCMLSAGEAHDDDRDKVAVLNAVGGLQQATLAVVSELRRSNDQRDVFNAAMLEFFERLTEDPHASPEGPSGAGATAQVVEKEGP